MDQRSSVDDRIFTAKVLHDALSLSLLHIGFNRVNDTIDDVLVLGDDEAIHAL